MTGMLRSTEEAVGVAVASGVLEVFNSESVDEVNPGVPVMTTKLTVAVDWPLGRTEVKVEIEAAGLPIHHQH